MIRYKATISYDGTLFSGFQRQPNARSIQEELERLENEKEELLKKKKEINERLKEIDARIAIIKR